NCRVTQAGQTVNVAGVHVVGLTNLAARVPADASALYARNVLDFLKLIASADGVKVDMEDDIVAACLVARDGVVTRS
ncbi:MAG: NAD(P)(+) transhydrogenase (Re/Si-specific) subunit alpha, partial [Burkholderiaceae bacterium]